MATPRASCWVKTSTAGPCGIDDGPPLAHCEGCARHPHSALRDVYTGAEFKTAADAALWAVRYVLRRQMEDVDTQYQIGIGTEVHRRCCLAVALAEGREPRDVEMENTMRSPAKSTIERLREQIEKMETT